MCVDVQYVSCLERIAQSVGLTLIDSAPAAPLSVDEATRQITERVSQLCDVTARDQQSLIQTLQHKLKSLKHRLHLKVFYLATVNHTYLYIRQHYALAVL